MGAHGLVFTCCLCLFWADRCAWSITLPWLPMLAALLDGHEDAVDLASGRLPALPPPTCSSLCDDGSDPAAPDIVASAVVGDTLTGCAVLLLKADGSCKACWPVAATGTGRAAGQGGEPKAALTPQQTQEDVQKQVLLPVDVSVCVTLAGSG